MIIITSIPTKYSILYYSITSTMMLLVIKMMKMMLVNCHIHARISVANLTDILPIPLT